MLFHEFFQSNFQLIYIISVSGFLWVSHSKLVKLLQTQVWPLNFTNFLNVIFGGFLAICPEYAAEQQVKNQDTNTENSRHSIRNKHLPSLKRTAVLWHRGIFCENIVQKFWRKVLRIYFEIVESSLSYWKKKWRNLVIVIRLKVQPEFSRYNAI